MNETGEEISVLHVDDEPDLADLASTYLDREDDRISVRTATSAAEGLELLAEHEVHCIVSDYDMPGKNGIEFLDAVRPGYPELPFILYTGKGSEEVASEAISAGVTDYLQKGADSSQYTVLANRISNAVEQYRSRRAVEATERKLSEIADNTDDVLFMFDGDWSELLFVNSSYEDVWGGSIEELERNPEAYLDRIHPEDREKARQSMARLSEGNADVIEYRVRDADGDYRWIRGESKPLFDDEGNVARIVGFVRDITTDKERNQTLRRKERRYQAVFNDPNILVGLLDTEGTVLDINQTAMDYIDVAHQDVVGGPFRETPWFDHSTAVQQEVQEWIERAARGEYVEFETELERPDGEPYVIEGVFRPVTTDEGDVVSLLITDRDVTDRAERERELERTNAVLSTLIETLPVGVLAEDDSRDVLAVNERLLELFGRSDPPEDLIGADCQQLADEVSGIFEAPETFGRRIDEVVEERTSIHGEDLALEDGRTLTRSYEPIELPDGEGHLWVYRDVTEQRE